MRAVQRYRWRVRGIVVFSVWEPISSFLLVWSFGLFLPKSVRVLQPVSYLRLKEPSPTSVTKCGGWIAIAIDCLPIGQRGHTLVSLDS